MATIDDHHHEPAGPRGTTRITGPMLIRMYDAYEEASNDPEVRCIVVTGAGGNFCSGADLRRP